MRDLNKIRAIEIYDYMVLQLAEGVFISKKRQREMLREIKFMIETS